MSSQGASRSCVRVCLSVGLSLAILTVVVGVLLFAFKLLLTKTATWVERTLTDIRISLPLASTLPSQFRPDSRIIRSPSAEPVPTTTCRVSGSMRMT